MKIMSINEFAHNVSSALVMEDNEFFAAEEERFNRKKKCEGHIAAKGTGPNLSYKWCLKKAGISKKDIDYLAVSWDIDLLGWFKNRRGHFKNYQKMTSKDSFSKARMYFKILHNYFERKNYFKSNFNGIKIIPIDHHLAHASCSYRLSNFDRAFVVILDGAGKDVSTSVYEAKGNEIKLIKSFPISQSMGIIYTKITRVLGLGDHGEGKTMALADYGQPIKNLNMTFSPH